MQAERVAVLGISGSGKSTFGQALASRAGLPLLHGDQLEWLPGWRERPMHELQAMHAEWLARPRWIIEGWMDVDRVARLQAADLVIDLDFSRWRCAWRVLHRMLRGTRRAEMPDRCVDRFRLRTLGVVFFKLERRHIDAALAQASPRNYVRLRSPVAVRRWLECAT